MTVEESQFDMLKTQKHSIYSKQQIYQKHWDIKNVSVENRVRTRQLNLGIERSLEA